MTMPHSAFLTSDEKKVVSDAMLLYIQQLQKKYYSETIIQLEEYNLEMKVVSEIIEKLHLSNKRRYGDY